MNNTSIWTYSLVSGHGRGPGLVSHFFGFKKKAAG